MKLTSSISLLNLITALLSGARAYNGIVDPASHHKYLKEFSKINEHSAAELDLCRQTYPETNFAFLQNKDMPCRIACLTSPVGELLGIVDKADGSSCLDDNGICQKRICVNICKGKNDDSVCSKGGYTGLCQEENCEVRKGAWDDKKCQEKEKYLFDGIF